jgi:putative nucleotidyltransferase-like protein
VIHSKTTSSGTLSPEVQILIACARTRLSDPYAKQIAALVRQPVDWTALINGATAHGVLPLLCRQLLTICMESVPVEWRPRMRMALHETAQRNLFLAAEMIRLAKLFRAEGILAIPYKGPLLAAQAYGDLALRQFADLDFALLQSEMPRAAALLEAEGFDAVFGRIESNEGARPTRSEYQFRKDPGNVIVELQTEMTLRYFPRPLEVEEMRKRLKAAKLADGETVGFSPEDTFILLAVHGAKHFWERLIWIADIAELTLSAGEMNWGTLFERANKMGAGRMVRLALCVASRMLDTPLPEEVLEQTQRDAVAHRLARGICERFSLEIQTPPVFQRFRFRVATREKFNEGVRYALKLATSPTDPDRADLPLPKKLSGAHRWVRPFLLIRRYGIRGPKSG